MAWIPVVEKLKDALIRGNWAAAEIQVNLLSKTDHPRDIFQNLTLNGVPALQNIAYLKPQGINIDRRNKVIKALLDSGYDINQEADLDSIRKWESDNTTALLAAIWARNCDLVRSLLRHGARTDIPDSGGNSPLRRAVLLGCRDIFDLLLDYGASVTSTEGEGSVDEGKIHPLLHTAVDSGCPRMVAHLLRKDIFDVNEKAVYRDNDPEETFTPLGRAIIFRNAEIFWILLDQPGIRVELEELRWCLVNWNAKMATSLLHHLSDFSNVNLVFFSPTTRWLSLGGNPSGPVKLRKYTLLHMACVRECREVIQALVMEVGADVNCKTEGDVELTPVQILLALKQWGMARFLIDNGADLSQRGSFGALPFTKVARMNLNTGKFEVNSSLTAVELVLRMGDRAGLPVLDKVMTKDDLGLIGATGFHLALEGGNIAMIATVLQKCSKMISKEGINWITVSGGKYAVQEEVPTLLWLLGNISSGLSLPDSNEPRLDLHLLLTTLVKLFVQKGYDLNLTWKSTPKTSPVVREPLLHYVLRLDMICRTNILLQTLSQLNHFQDVVPVTCVEGRKCLEYLLSTWNDCCQANEGTECWRPQQSGERMTCCVDAVKLLMRHGLNASQVVIRKEFKFHFGYKPMIQLLYRNGARIADGYFSREAVCGTSGFVRELAKLMEWKEEFDLEKPINLKNVCRLRVRKMLTGSEDLKIFQGLPDELKEFVLTNDIV